nr:uncharacterized protein LOC109155647 [Ipomoea batatas]
MGKSEQDPYPLNLGRCRGVVSGRRIGVGHWTGGRRWIGHHAHHGREVLLIQGLLEGLPHGLLHLEPTLRMSPRAIAPSELFSDLLVDERSEEGLRFPGISTQETGEVGVARHLLIHLGSLPLCCLDLELRTRDPSFQCLYLLGQLLILRRQTFPQREDVFAHHVLRGLGSAEKVVRHVRKLQRREPYSQDDLPLIKYPYLDFFNEQENQEMEYAADPEADDQDLRSHLNARMGSDRTHPAEPPPQDPVNVIHEVPVYPQATGPAMYQYPVHPMGVPDLNYPWWQGTPQYYPTPYQFPQGIFPQPAYFPVPETPPNPVHPELRRAQSERRPSGPYRDPSGPSRATLPTQTEAVEAADNESPRRRSAFDRLRRSARDMLGLPWRFGEQ